MNPQPPPVWPPPPRDGLRPETLRAGFVAACTLDVQVRKPGNVSVASAGHRMQAQQFIDSAHAAAGALCTAGMPVGERIERAMDASLAAAGCNTNLGIVLLCAPLAAAAETWRPGRGASALRERLEQVLQRLDIDDAQAAYRAIARTQPGGLGTAPQQDVARPPTVALREAMALAARRDRIAAQYADTPVYAEVFDLALPAFAAAGGQAMQSAYIELLCHSPDSHIVRRHGAAMAHCVMSEALPWRERLRDGVQVEADSAWARWDQSLKDRGLNPGTCADLSVATAWVAWMCGQTLRPRG